MRLPTIRGSIVIGATFACVLLAPEVAQATTDQGSAISLQGTAWSTVTVPEPSATFDGKLLGATCSSNSNCLAVGWGFNDGFVALDARRAVERKCMDTTGEPEPDRIGRRLPQLNAVSCVNQSDCTTVGTDFTTSNTANTVAALWDGTDWSIATTPDAAGATTSTLAGVSCLSADFCMAVGSAGTTSPDVITLAEQWNGSVWSVETTPNVDRAIQTFLTSVACPATNECIAVGYGLSAAGTIPIAEQWNGTSWTLVDPPVPTGSADNELTAVGCPGNSTSCFAAGRTYATSSSGPLTLAEEWNGTDWSTMDHPRPGGARRCLLQFRLLPECQRPARPPARA